MIGGAISKANTKNKPITLGSVNDVSVSINKLNKEKEASIIKRQADTRGKKCLRVTLRPSLNNFFKSKW